MSDKAQPTPVSETGWHVNPKSAEESFFADVDILRWDGLAVAVVLQNGGLPPVEVEKTARLIAAAPDMLAAQTMGAQVNTPDFLDWIADRLVNVYGESPNVDFVLSLRDRAKAGRAAIAKATGA